MHQAGRRAGAREAESVATLRTLVAAVLHHGEQAVDTGAALAPSPLPLLNSRSQRRPFDFGDAVSTSDTRLPGIRRHAHLVDDYPWLLAEEQAEGLLASAGHRVNVYFTLPELHRRCGARAQAAAYAPRDYSDHGACTPSNDDEGGAATPFTPQAKLLPSLRGTHVAGAATAAQRSAAAAAAAVAHVARTVTHWRADVFRARLAAEVAETRTDATALASPAWSTLDPASLHEASMEPLRAADAAIARMHAEALMRFLLPTAGPPSATSSGVEEAEAAEFFMGTPRGAPDDPAAARARRVLVMRHAAAAGDYAPSPSVLSPVFASYTAGGGGAVRHHHGGARRRPSPRQTHGDASEGHGSDPATDAAAMRLLTAGTVDSSMALTTSAASFPPRSPEADRRRARSPPRWRRPLVFAPSASALAAGEDPNVAVAVHAAVSPDVLAGVPAPAPPVTPQRPVAGGADGTTGARRGEAPAPPLVGVSTAADGSHHARHLAVAGAPPAGAAAAAPTPVLVRVSTRNALMGPNGPSPVVAAGRLRAFLQVVASAVPVGDIDREQPSAPQAAAAAQRRQSMASSGGGGGSSTAAAAAARRTSVLGPFAGSPAHRMSVADGATTAPPGGSWAETPVPRDGAALIAFHRRLRAAYDALPDAQRPPGAGPRTILDAALRCPLHGEAMADPVAIRLVAAAPPVATIDAGGPLGDAGATGQRVPSPPPIDSLEGSLMCRSTSQRGAHFGGAAAPPSARGGAPEVAASMATPRQRQAARNAHRATIDRTSLALLQVAPRDAFPAASVDDATWDALVRSAGSAVPHPNFPLRTRIRMWRAAVLSELVAAEAIASAKRDFCRGIVIGDILGSVLQMCEAVPADATMPLTAPLRLGKPRRVAFHVDVAGARPRLEAAAAAHAALAAQCASLVDAYADAVSAARVAEIDVDAAVADRTRDVGGGRDVIAAAAATREQTATVLAEIEHAYFGAATHAAALAKTLAAYNALLPGYADFCRRRHETWHPRWVRSAHNAHAVLVALAAQRMSAQGRLPVIEACAAFCQMPALQMANNATALAEGIADRLRSLGLEPLPIAATDVGVDDINEFGDPDVDWQLSPNFNVPPLPFAHVPLLAAALPAGAFQPSIEAALPVVAAAEGDRQHYHRIYTSIQQTLAATNESAGVVVRPPGANRHTPWWHFAPPPSFHAPAQPLATHRQPPRGAPRHPRDVHVEPMRSNR